ncbi:hypothetical protein ABER75_11510 [Niallia taxi]|uniref:hypothetical protein n=1 Tax=Niallia taxi TaxID=2499688 RepID=UPI00203E287A|nr:hypothetical protein [Niallia taxi]MCM3216720.1 hypothetical protein [Niallia taxi]
MEEIRDIMKSPLGLLIFLMTNNRVTERFSGGLHKKYYKKNLMHVFFSIDY